MGLDFLPYSRQSIDESDIAEVVRVLKGDWLTTGPEVLRFEEALSDYCGVRYVVACASGTAALHLAAMALGLTVGDAVITSPVTFLSTANCARFVGADVQLADVDERTVNLDPDEVGKVLAEKEQNVKAILPVHFGGHPADMESFAALAKQYNLKIIEDGCHALGASYTTTDGKDVRVGSCRHSDLTVFSFHPVKAITTGEGGAVTTNDQTLYERLLLLRNHGMVREENLYHSFLNSDAAFDESGNVLPWYYEMQSLGYNYRITDFQSALGTNQLKKIEQFVSRKTSLAACYREKFAASSILRPLVIPLTIKENIRHGYHLFVVRIDFKSAGISRAALMKQLQAKGIGTQVHYIPLHFQPYYQKHTRLVPGSLPRAESYYAQCVSLPLFPAMTEKDIDRVIKALEDILTGGGNYE